MITVDTNAAEDDVFNAITELGAPVQRGRLDVGDVLIETDEGQICVERKRWSDLAASICDGRLKEQKSRMIASDTIRYAYVIEGDLTSWDGAHRGMSHRCMWCALVKTALRDNITVFHTSNPRDSAALCNYILIQLRDGGFRAGGGTSAVAGLTKRKRENLADPTSILRAMLTTVPGMSLAKAQVVTTEFPTVAALSAASEAQLAAVDCSGRKLGPKMAKVLHEIFVV